MTRQFATIAVLAVLGCVAPQLRFHIGAGMNVGITEEQVVEIIAWAQYFAGAPAACSVSQRGRLMTSKSQPITRIGRLQSSKLEKICLFELVHMLKTAVFNRLPNHVILHPVKSHELQNLP